MTSMITFTTVITFSILAFVMALSPGPNLIYLVSRSVCQGTKAGFASLAGVSTAMLFYMVVTAAGLSVVFDAVPVTYDIVRLIGVVYLLWLVFKALTRDNDSFIPETLASINLQGLYRKGFITCLLNPKIVLTYGAFLPQFIKPELGNVLVQTIELGLVQIVAAATAHSCVILTASKLSSLINRTSWFIRMQRYILAALLSMVAFRIAFDQRSST